MLNFFLMIISLPCHSRVENIMKCSISSRKKDSRYKLASSNTHDCFLWYTFTTVSSNSSKTEDDIKMGKKERREGWKEKQRRKEWKNGLNEWKKERRKERQDESRTEATKGKTARGRINGKDVHGKLDTDNQRKREFCLQHAWLFFQPPSGLF